MREVDRRGKYSRRIFLQGAASAVPVVAVAASAGISIEIVDDDGEMAISVARTVRLLSPEIHSQFEFERRRRVVQINQREVRKYKAIGNLQVKRAGVEIE